VENTLADTFYSVHAFADSTLSPVIYHGPFDVFSPEITIGTFYPGASQMEMWVWVRSDAAPGDSLAIPVVFHDQEVPSELSYLDSIVVSVPIRGVDSAPPWASAEALPRFARVDSVVTISAEVYEPGEIGLVRVQLNAAGSMVGSVALVDDGMHYKHTAL